MATVALILQAIVAVMKFPAAMASFIKLVSKTPAEKQADITAAIEAQLQSFEQTGRPS